MNRYLTLFCAILLTSLTVPGIIPAEEGMVVLKGHYREPDFIHEGELTILRGINSGEYLEVDIQGTVHDFRHISLEFDGSDLVGKELLNSLGTLSDCRLLIETYLPEGIPSERISWKDKNGNSYSYSYSYNFYENGMGDNYWEFPISGNPSFRPFRFVDISGLPNARSAGLRPSQGDFISPGGIYPVGWSRDGKFAYVVLGSLSDSGRSHLPVEFIIVDMVSDEEIYSRRIPGSELAHIRLAYETPATMDPLFEVAEAWHFISEEFESELRAHGICKHEGVDLLSFPLSLDNRKYTAAPDGVTSGIEGNAVLAEYSLRVEKSGIGGKVISRGRSGDEQSITGVTVNGAFKSPFENRIAVLYSVMALGENESSGESRDFVSLHLSGCHLGIGFK